MCDSEVAAEVTSEMLAIGSSIWRAGAVEISRNRYDTNLSTVCYLALAFRNRALVAAHKVEQIQSIVRICRHTLQDFQCSNHMAKSLVALFPRNAVATPG